MHSYYSHVNSELLCSMPMDAHVIIECGCGTGVLGKAYKERNPRAFYVGIELNESVAKEAREYLDLVICGDIERIDIKEVLATLAIEQVDCLIYGDVLEHLNNPWKLLQEHSQLLSEKGLVVASIPNVQNWWLIANLIAGRWEYTDSGLLDRTHLRFFTLESIRKLFSEAGLFIHEMRSRIVENPQRKRIQEILRRTAQELGVENLAQNETQMSALQYIVRAGKNRIKHRMLLHAMLGEPKVTAAVRIREPHLFCSTQPTVRCIENVEKVEWPDSFANEHKVFIWQRFSPRTFEQQKDLIRRGYLIICEIDDDPERWPNTYEKKDYLAFRSCHAVQVSTEPLAEFIRQYNPNVKVFANQIAVLPEFVKRDGKKQVTLFFGALNRESDWQPIMASLNQVLSEFPHRVIVIHDRKFYEALNTDHKEFVPFCPYEKYQELLRQADVALLPLQENRFNSMKSELKFLECAANSVVALASPTVYSKYVQEGRTGFVYRSPEEFEEKARQILGDAALRQKVAQEAYQWVKENRMLAYHYKERLEWYASLWENYEKLTQDIFRRMQEISD